MMADKNRMRKGQKLRGADKVRRIPIKVVPTEGLSEKPAWIRVRVPSNNSINKIKEILRRRQLVSVCEEANCPNISECFSQGTATFMIMGDICTRRCPFCDVAHGAPMALNEDEPRQLADAVLEMSLKYVVVTSVDRDDLKDRGARHFAECIRIIRQRSPATTVEILVPDFRGRMELAIGILSETPPNVFNHNLETIPRLYKKVRPGADYYWSLDLLRKFKRLNPTIPTKSGLMLGLGENNDEVIDVMEDLRANDVDMLTLGQYMQPSRNHLRVERFVHPDVFNEMRGIAESLGFHQVASAPLVRSSYHADLQATGQF